MDKKIIPESEQEIFQNMENELDSLKKVCDEYKKQKAFNMQLIISIICAFIFYCQQYVWKNNIDIGLPRFSIFFIGIMAICAIVFGWISYFFEYKQNNDKLFKIVQISIWIIEVIGILVFIIMLFLNN